MAITGFVPSYIFDSGIGKKIARLKGLDEGWHYPTFLLQYVRNPGPLLLFDELLIDRAATEKAVEYVCQAKKAQDYESQTVKATRPTNPEKKAFQDLVQSSIFKKVNVAEMISDEDFQRIAKGYNADMGFTSEVTPEYIHELKRAIGLMKERYGQNYASPDPERFEIMNLNVTQVLLEKLSAHPLDDIFRVPLYETKTIAASLATLETKIAFEIIDKARQVLYLPTEPLQDIDTFLALHRDPRVQHFRNKVSELALKKATPQQISKELHDAELELQKLDIDSFNLILGFLGLGGSLATLLSGNFVSGIVGTFLGLAPIGKELIKVSKAERYDWLEAVKGLCEM